VIDNTAELERQRMSAIHEHTLAVTETWANSIANERKARITRLEREAQQREEALKAVDDDERKFQKARRKELLKHAELQGFEQRPEVRAVHSQLLLHEVTRERQRQLLLKEHQQNVEDLKEDEYAAEQRRKFQEFEAKEREVQEQRRRKAIEVAAGVKQQKMEAEERKRMEREDERIQESLASEEAARLVHEDKKAEISRREQAGQHVREVAAANRQMIGWKERQAEIERIEDERITAQKYALDDAMEARQMAELQRKQTRQAEIDRLIARQQETMRAIQSQNEGFDDRQYEKQMEKDLKEIRDLRAKEVRLAKERREDFLISRAKIEAKRERVKEKVQFPPDEAVLMQEDGALVREQERAQAVKDLAEFRRQQAEEKRQREEAEKERTRLEFNRQIELTQAKTADAQDYARVILREAHARHKRR
jgi:hypothetical protein